MDEMEIRVFPQGVGIMGKKYQPCNRFERGSNNTFEIICSNYWHAASYVIYILP